MSPKVDVIPPELSSLKLVLCALEPRCDDGRGEIVYLIISIYDVRYFNKEQSTYIIEISLLLNLFIFYFSAILHITGQLITTCSCSH